MLRQHGDPGYIRWHLRLERLSDNGFYIGEPVRNNYLHSYGYRFEQLLRHCHTLCDGECAFRTGYFGYRSIRNNGQ